MTTNWNHDVIKIDSLLQLRDSKNQLHLQMVHSWIWVLELKKSRPMAQQSSIFSCSRNQNAAQNSWFPALLWFQSFSGQQRREANLFVKLLLAVFSAEWGRVAYEHYRSQTRTRTGNFRWVCIALGFEKMWKWKRCKALGLQWRLHQHTEPRFDTITR